MASTSKKGKTGTQTKRKTASSGTAAAHAAKQRPIRREVWALVCFFVALFSFIGYFKLDALFITYFCAFIKGLIGYGYYLFPPAMLACAVILLFHRGRPVLARTICMLCVPLAVGALAHLFAFHQNLEGLSATELLPLMYESGQEMHSGGLICGVLANGAMRLVSVYGAVPVFFFALVALLMAAMRITPSMLAEKYKNRPRRERLEYEPQPEPERKQPARAAAYTAPAAVSAPVTGHKRHAIDIPMDDEVSDEAPYVENKVGFFNTNPRVKSPDQVLARHAAADAAAAAAAEPAPETVKSAVQPVEAAVIPAPAPVAATAVPAPVSTAVKANPTAEVAPLSVEEAADLAGITLETPAPVPAVKTEGFTTAEVRTARSAARKEIEAEELRSNTEEVAKAVEEKDATVSHVYNIPPVSLLRQGSGAAADGSEEVRMNSDRLQATLDSFGVGATIRDTTRGPTVTRYDVELETGVKLAKLTNLAGDLALSLGVTGVRIAPIPDKLSTVGIEVPNKIVSTVYLRDIIDTDVFRAAPSKLTFALGKDIGGNAITGNIAKLPHLLIAGTTGSGKSVCMNSLILSLLYKASPEEVRLIMIDPQMVELGIYNGIPHLYIPVVTDPKKAAGSLQWSVVEMLKRYRLFSERGVRDLASYNTLQRKDGEPILPQVVIVIDELADLMMTAAKEVEESICRVAQMGRAAGMHLVIATQRPSADVITGLMKANIPSRIAFAVSSAMESRIILDQMGAEKLVGMGDMLYAPLGVGKPQRIQGAFVTDDEREDVVNYVKQYGEAQYSEEIMASIEKAAEDKSSASAKAESVEEPAGSDYDELLPQAVDVIFETKQASVSMLQRRLKLGYSRAARIVDQMEEIGVVGPFEGSKPRQILITREQWLEMQTVQGTAPTETLADQTSFADFEDVPPEHWDEEL